MKRIESSKIDQLMEMLSTIDHKLGEDGTLFIGGSFEDEVEPICPICQSEDLYNIHRRFQCRCCGTVFTINQVENRKFYN